MLTDRKNGRRNQLKWVSPNPYLSFCWLLYDLSQLFSHTASTIFRLTGKNRSFSTKTSFFFLHKIEYNQILNLLPFYHSLECAHTNVLKTPLKDILSDYCTPHCYSLWHRHQKVSLSGPLAMLFWLSELQLEKKIQICRLSFRIRQNQYQASQ